MQHSGKRHKDAAHASSCQPVCLHFFKPRTYLQVHAVICVPHKKEPYTKKNHSQAHCVSFTIIWRSYDSWVLCIPVSEQSGLFFFTKSPLPSNYKLPHQKSPTDRSTVLRELDLRLILYLPLCLIMSLCYPDYNNLVIIKKE